MLSLTMYSVKAVCMACTDVVISVQWRRKYTRMVTLQSRCHWARAAFWVIADDPKLTASLQQTLKSSARE